MTTGDDDRKERGRPENEYNPRISAYLRSLRSRTGMTQEDLAQKVGVSSRTIQNLEGIPTTGKHGKRQVSEIYLSTARRLMDVLGGDLDHLARLYDEEQDIGILETEQPAAPALASYLKDRMQRTSWALADLAAATGVSEDTLRHILDGRMPSAADLWLISKGLSADFDALMAMLGLPTNRAGVSRQAAHLLQREEMLPVLRHLMQVPDEGLPAVRAYLLLLAKQYAGLHPGPEAPEESDQ